MTSEIETTSRRSDLMSRVRQKGTDLELAVRRLLWHAGARYRVNVENLPGSPDIANKVREKAIFVHGCFWHKHENCNRGRIPTRNRSFWADKLERNKERDRRKEERLRELGYEVMTVWECELDDPISLQKRLIRFWDDGHEDSP